MAKLLLIEDDEVLIKLYETKFSHTDYKVTVARNGKEGIEKAEEILPDIILLDVMMPVMNGFEALKILKNNPKTNNIPVIVLSNYGELANVTEGFNEGAAEYLIKAEHTPDEILDTVELILKNKTPIIGDAFN